jgi:hypothetical protein
MQLHIPTVHYLFLTSHLLFFVHLCTYGLGASWTRRILATQIIVARNTDNPTEHYHIHLELTSLSDSRNLLYVMHATFQPRRLH